MNPIIKAPKEMKLSKKSPRANKRFEDTPAQKKAASLLFLKALGGLARPAKKPKT